MYPNSANKILLNSKIHYPSVRDIPTQCRGYQHAIVFFIWVAESYSVR